MSLNQFEISKIIHELKKIIIPSKIEKIIETSPLTYLFKLFKNESYHLLVSLNTKEMRIHLCQDSHKNKEHPHHFLEYLKKYVQNGKLEDIQTLNSDRLVEMKIMSHGKIIYLVFEMIPRVDNIIILDEQRKITYNLKPLRVPLCINEEYSVPEKKEYISKLNIIEQDNELYNQTVEKYYNKIIQDNQYHENHFRILSSLNKDLKKTQKLLMNLENQYNECNLWEDWQRKGELLKANYHLLKKGLELIKVQNYFDSNLDEINIPLDPQKDPSENINHFFTKSKKLKSGISHIEGKYTTTKEKYTQLKQMTDELQSIPDQRILDEFTRKYKLDSRISHEKKNNSPAKKESKALGYHIFMSSKGVPIYVGKKNTDNDRLTFSIAKGNDMWLHVRDYPGSHVVVPLNKTQVINQETLYEAGQLALNYSKAKSHQQGEVMYTYKKFLSKAKGSPPGQVQVSQFKTMFIKLDSECLRDIKERSQ